MDDLQQRTEKTAACLRAAAAARGLFVSADDRISEADAAEMLGYAVGSLRNMRAAGGGPTFFNRPLGSSAKSYRLEDLAAWVERSREETI